MFPNVLNGQNRLVQVYRRQKVSIYPIYMVHTGNPRLHQVPNSSRFASNTLNRYRCLANILSSLAYGWSYRRPAKRLLVSRFSACLTSFQYGTTIFLFFRPSH